jgi:hypothetical protein
MPLHQMHSRSAHTMCRDPRGAFLSLLQLTSIKELRTKSNILS